MAFQPGHDMYGRFIYREVAAPERLVFVSSFSDAEGGITRAPFPQLEGRWPLEVLNTMTLTEQGGKTTLSLRCGPINVTEEERTIFAGMADSMRQGFGGTFISSTHIWRRPDAARHASLPALEDSMLKIVGIIAVVLLVVVAAVLIYAATKPDDFRVQRSLPIKAPPEKIFALINDLHGWGAWSPYEKRDPAMKRTFSGAARDTGAVYEWDGNNNVGKGRMEITNTSAPNKIVIKLEFIKPFESHNVAKFTIAPQGDATNVTWAMYGPAAYITKLMGTFMNMDKMIGNDFEAGLASLKTLAEK